MKTCFIISAFGDTDCDKVYEEVYVPLCKKLNLKPVRLDKENNGTLVMNQIISYINDSEIIIADLTLARPNCYFEIGFSMGAKRESRVFLTCREDHSTGSKDFKNDGFRIHFDVAGYDINFWKIDEIGKIRQQLEDKITARMKTWIITEATKNVSLEKPLNHKFEQIIASANKD